jgi:hypothetical protein
MSVNIEIERVTLTNFVNVDHGRGKVSIGIFSMGKNISISMNLREATLLAGQILKACDAEDLNKDKDET